MWITTYDPVSTLMYNITYTFISFIQYNERNNLIILVVQNELVFNVRSYFPIAIICLLLCFEIT